MEMTRFSDEAWAIASQYSSVLASETRDLGRQIDAALFNSKSEVALWMMGHGYATGHGDTISDMLDELESQIVIASNLQLTITSHEHPSPQAELVPKTA